MKYNLALSHDIAEAQRLLAQLTIEQKIVDIKEVKPKRSLSQNNYLYLLLGAFGQHFGYTLEEAKAIYKELNRGIYEYTREVRGKTHTFYRSSADLSKDEMAQSIDVLREWSEKAGYPLPLATDTEALRALENEIEAQERYLRGRFD